jgi:hypothetical protein
VHPGRISFQLVRASFENGPRQAEAYPTAPRLRHYSGPVRVKEFLLKSIAHYNENCSPLHVEEE